jgi:hypothetical protein
MEESSEDDDYDSLPTLIVGGECSGDCAGDMVKLTGKTDFSTVSSNSDRRQLYPNVEWLPGMVQANVGQKLLKRNILRVFTMSLFYNILGDYR